MGIQTVPRGQELRTALGSQTWTCPDYVFSVCVVCVGGGGGGNVGDKSRAYGGGGGGLGYKNNIAVTPGTNYTLFVGAGGSLGVDGEDSYFISVGTVAGLGGTSSTDTTGDYGIGGSYIPFPNNGGIGGDSAELGTNSYGAGGGGAGGYTPLGGFSESSNSGELNFDGWDGYGGAGGGGGAGDPHGGGGGGVDVEGQGSNGAGGLSTSPAGGDAGGGGGGSNGADGGTGDPADGGLYGGGGAGVADRFGTAGVGAQGAVRIIWGTNRAFPSTNTADV